MNQRALTGVVHALLADDGTGEVPWTQGVPARVDGFLAALPAPTRQAFHSFVLAFDAYAVLRCGRRLDALSPVEHERLLASLPRTPGFAALMDAVKVPVLLAAGTERLVDRQAADSGGRPPVPPPPDPPLDCVPSGRWPDRTRADAVVVGSGAGGSIAALTLARAGLRTLVVEEGEHHTTASFAQRLPLDRFTDLYRDAGAGIALGNPPILLPTGRAVGGTTVVNAGTCYRTPDRVLTRWRDRHGLDLANPVAFAPWLDHAEQLLQVARQPLDVLGGNGRTALHGAHALGWRADALRRNAPGCQGSCQCVVGCPSGAKQSVQLSVLPAACAEGTTIVTSARVRRILLDHDDARGRPRAAGVLVRRPDGSDFEILSPLVVVAAGALQTPALLRRSGLGAHPRLGRNLSVHPATSVAGRFDEPVDSSRGVLQSVAVEEFHDQGILLEATAGPPGMSSFVLPGTGRALRTELDGDRYLATVGAMIADRPGGRVIGSSGRAVRYRLDPADADRLRHAVDAMGRLLFAAGAREVLTGIAGTPAVTGPRQLRDLLAGLPASRLHVSAFHPTGTVAMGDDPERHPATPDGRLRGVDGIVIRDASLLPSCPEVNPQLTIMALVAATAAASPDG